MTDISHVVNKLCELGADAVQRYVELAGPPLTRMPEYFMPALILSQLTARSAALEIGFADLGRWDADTRRRRGDERPAGDNHLLATAERLFGKRIDMVLFEDGTKDLLALVEFKRGYIDSYQQPLPGPWSDRDKLLLVLEQLDTCPWGIVCGWTHSVQRKWQIERDMSGTKDQWYERSISVESDQPLFFCARLFARGSDQARLAQLKASSV